MSSKKTVPLNPSERFQIAEDGESVRFPVWFFALFDLPEWQELYEKQFLEHLLEIDDDEEREREVSRLERIYLDTIRKDLGDYFSDELGLKLEIDAHLAVTLSPVESWEKVGAILLDTIKGVGEWSFDSIEELQEVGPYKSIQEGIMMHLHHHVRRGAVYGEEGIVRIFENGIERRLR